MKLNFRTLRGEPFELTIENSMSVKSIKDLLKKKFQLIPNNITLINGTKILTDSSIVDPKTFEYNDFIVIHEDNRSLRENTSKAIIKTPFSLLRTNSTPASNAGSSNKSPSVPLVPGRTNIDRNRRNQKQIGKKSGIDQDFEKSHEFQEILKSFDAMGFEKQRSIELLRKFNYDIDIAINYSITGVMPSEEIEEEEEVKEEIKEKPKPKPKPREHDVSGLNSFRLGEFKSQIFQLSNEKQYGLLRFLTEHRDMEVDYLIQIFFSCDSDYTIATHCLTDI